MLAEVLGRKGCQEAWTMAQSILVMLKVGWRDPAPVLVGSNCQLLTKWVLRAEQELVHAPLRNDLVLEGIVYCRVKPDFEIRLEPTRNGP